MVSRAPVLSVLAVALAVALGCGQQGDDRPVRAASSTAGTAESTVTTISDRLSFLPSEGWKTITPDTARLMPKQAGNIEIAWTTNAPIAERDEQSGMPEETGKTLPPDGVIVYASLARRVDDPGSYPERELPLRLVDAFCARDHYDNQPAPHVSMCSLNATIDGFYLTVAVYFGANDPDRRLRDAAQEALGRLLLPGLAVQAPAEDQAASGLTTTAFQDPAWAILDSLSR